jgi:hypothetical protein
MVNYLTYAMIKIPNPYFNSKDYRKSTTKRGDADRISSHDYNLNTFKFYYQNVNRINLYTNYNNHGKTNTQLMGEDIVILYNYE